ncbi:hypothetical protein JYU34_006867 [Plutella xylostella]|uniref:Insulin-like growth factor-binding protein complex acid labile subunit n=1 Tax=Plutella xylostella TaxID=51655 RepID=A0ABQ7QT20_PLUXY|nr:hypothetical protein JYU34_006867 [Plutella xylostella]
MAFKLYLFVGVLFSCQLSHLAWSCPAECQTCSYNVTLKEKNTTFHERVCCDNTEQFKWHENYKNKTQLEVSVKFALCNKSYVELNFTKLNISSLTLSYNSIVKLKLILKPQTLRVLDISRNKLQFVTKDLFNNFTNLRQLVLSKNEIVNISDGSFDGLTSLESLDLSENNVSSLASILTPLKNLQHLNLSRNSIGFLHSSYFDNSLLQQLDVSHNDLAALAPGALQLLPSLARLRLSDNPRLGRAPPALLVGAGRRLQQLDAARTGLRRVPDPFTHSVRFLSLVGNRIAAVRRGDLDSYPLLQSLDFSDNRIESVEDDSLGRLEMLLFLNFNRNLLTTVPKSLPEELKYLSINNNFIGNLTASDFKELPNLRILLLQHNQIRYLDERAFDELPALELLDLSHNPLRRLAGGALQGPRRLRELRLSGLAAAVAAGAEGDGGFPAPAGVARLQLAASPGLARALLADPAALAALSHLQYLDLRMNNLTDIRNDLLFYLGQLRTLRLHGNNINCSAELWLKDWLSWNESSTSGETCYYSSSEPRDDENKDNNTFSETFTISDSLPPVNLYSTEMINKLLRYYGYLNNKTERIQNESDNSKLKSNATKANIDTKSIEENTIYKNVDNPFLLRIDNRISSNEYSNESAAAKARESARVLEQGRVRARADRRVLDLGPGAPAADPNKSNYEEVTQLRRKYRAGKRLNTPVNAAKKEVISEVSTTGPPESASVNVSVRVEYSPYQSSPSPYARYVGAGGALALAGLAALALALGAARRRRPVARPAAADRDQIEVANISGGVLW